jgi:hypothetical protein
MLFNNRPVGIFSLLYLKPHTGESLFPGINLSCTTSLNFLRSREKYTQVIIFHQVFFSKEPTT